MLLTSRKPSLPDVMEGAFRGLRCIRGNPGESKAIRMQLVPPRSLTIPKTIPIPTRDARGGWFPLHSRALNFWKRWVTTNSTGKKNAAS